MLIKTLSQTSQKRTKDTAKQLVQNMLLKDYNWKECINFMFFECKENDYKK